MRITRENPKIEEPGRLGDLHQGAAFARDGKVGFVQEPEKSLVHVTWIHSGRRGLCDPNLMVQRVFLEEIVTRKAASHFREEGP